MPPSPSLAELQRWMRWALTHPLGAARAVAGEQLAGLPDRFAEPPARALAAVAGDPDAGRTAVERLSVHASGYFGRLHGTLEIEYPRLAAALGERAFRSVVAAHLLRSPSTGPSLADLGEGLAETLKAHPASLDARWLVDLAAVERATAEVWLSDAAGADGGSLADGEDWGQVHLALAPAARLLRLAWDVADWAPDRGRPSDRPGWLVVWRVEASTGTERLEDGPGALLDALARGTALGEVCELAGRAGMSAGEVTAAFEHWAARGWLAQRAVTPGPRPHTSAARPR